MSSNKLLNNEFMLNNYYYKLICKLNKEEDYKLNEFIHKEVSFLEKIHFFNIKNIKNLIEDNNQEIEKHFDKFLFISGKNSKVIDEFEKKITKPIYRIDFNYSKENKLFFSNLKNIEKKVDLFLKESNNKDNILLIFNDLITFLNYYDFQLVENFFKLIKHKLDENNLILLFLLNKDFNFMKESQQIKFNRIISILIEFSYFNIMNLLSHPIRRIIIKLLIKKSSLNYNEIFYNISFVKPSSLDYHINILLKENIISKKGKLYNLTQRGLYFSKIINLLDTLSLIDPGSPIKIL